MEAKAEHIAWRFFDPRLAEAWYTRLTADMQKDLSTFPYKFQLYDAPPWRERGIRLYLSRSDVVLYRVDDVRSRVYIEAVYTKGKNLNEA